EWGMAPFNVRLGLTHWTEVGIFISPYVRSTATATGWRERSSGFGDVTLRGKFNIAGNDGGGFAWGLMADLKLPTAAAGLGNDKYEGALTLPVAFELGGGWGGGAMTSVEMIYTGAGRHRAVWSNTLTVGRDLSENVGGYVELTSSAGDGTHIATCNAGLTRALGANAQLDCGINVGISRAAPDLQLFAGISRRF
ncbi:MAG: transporter, partial [Opitutaceae bacterium]